jgi:hypothetical protein
LLKSSNRHPPCSINPHREPTKPKPKQHSAAAAAAATDDAAAAAAAAIDESGTSASGGGFFAGFGLGSFGLGGDLLAEESEEESEDDENGPWAVMAGAGDAEGRYNLAHWQSLLEALQQARHPRYYDEVGIIVICFIRYTADPFVDSPRPLPTHTTQKATVVEAVRSFTELLLYGEARGDERMFEFFGHHNLLLLFCHMVRGWMDGWMWPAPLSSSSLLPLIPFQPFQTQAREPRLAVQTAVLGSIGLLLYNVKREEALHYLLSHDLLASFDAATLQSVEEVSGLCVLDRAAAKGSLFSTIFILINLIVNHQVRAPYVSLLRTIALRITAGTAPLFLDHRKVTHPT